MLREGGANRLLWHPDEPMRIWRQLRRLWMRLVAIKHLRNRLAFVRRQSRYEDQRLTLSLTLPAITAPAYACATETTGASVCSRARSSAPMSSDNDVSGIGAARTFSPLASSGPIIRSSSSRQPTHREPTRHWICAWLRSRSTPSCLTSVSCLRGFRDFAVSR